MPQILLLVGCIVLFFVLLYYYRKFTNRKRVKELTQLLLNHEDKSISQLHLNRKRVVKLINTVPMFDLKLHIFDITPKDQREVIINRILLRYYDLCVLVKDSLSNSIEIPPFDFNYLFFGLKNKLKLIIALLNHRKDFSLSKEIIHCLLWDMIKGSTGDLNDASTSKLSFLDEKLIEAFLDHLSKTDSFEFCIEELFNFASQKDNSFYRRITKVGIQNSTRYRNRYKVLRSFILLSIAKTLSSDDMMWIALRIQVEKFSDQGIRNKQLEKLVYDFREHFPDALLVRVKQ